MENYITGMLSSYCRWILTTYNAANPTAPWGWRVPTSADFTTLSTYLGGDAVAGRKNEKRRTTYWNILILELQMKVDLAA